MRIFLSARSTKKRSFEMGFHCATSGLACLLKDNVVRMPYLCRKAKTTRMSFLKLVAAGRFWLQADRSSSSNSQFLNSVLIPMSKRCRGRISWNCTCSFPTDRLPSGSIFESAQSKLYEEFVRVSLLACIFSLFNFSSSRISFRMHICMGVSSRLFLAFCGIGSH